MKLVYFSNYLNHHLVFASEEWYKLLREDFCFVATMPRSEKNLKGGEDYSGRSYCVLAGESEEAHQRALQLAQEAEVCIFGACSQEYALERAKHNVEGLSFEVSERWLKKGLINALSPTIRKNWWNYIRYYRKANFYKLCQSGFAAGDENKLGVYKGKHYKWAYFTSVDSLVGNNITSEILRFRDSDIPNTVRLMWCARFIKLKHPELPVKMAKTLKEKGYDFVLDFYGGGPEEEPTKQLAKELNLEDVVKFHGAKPNNKILEAMSEHDIFLFTSNKLEGWGAVVNEAMSNGCAVVSADCIGSTPYLIKDGVTGFSFKAGNVASLTEKVERMLNQPEELLQMKKNAYEQMQNVWSPKNAAASLLQLIDDLQNGRETSIKEGPCSKA